MYKVSTWRGHFKLKCNCCSKYRQALMSTGVMVIAEATQDNFWGVGVALSIARHTQPFKFLGVNQLGRLHITLRDIVSERESQNCNSDFDVYSTHLISAQLNIAYRKLFHSTLKQHLPQQVSRRKGSKVSC